MNITFIFWYNHLFTCCRLCCIAKSLCNKLVTHLRLMLEIYFDKNMSRCLRSKTRWQKLQVQQIRQVDKELRGNISNCTETKIESFEQQEFLSLFGLIPSIEQSDTKKRKLLSSQRTTVDNSMKKDALKKVKKTMEKRSPQHTNNIGYRNLLQSRAILGKRYYKFIKINCV